MISKISYNHNNPNIMKYSARMHKFDKNQADCIDPGLHNIRPARAFSIVENVAKAQPQISNCHSVISSILEQKLY